MFSLRAARQARQPKAVLFSGFPRDEHVQLRRPGLLEAGWGSVVELDFGNVAFELIFRYLDIPQSFPNSPIIPAAFGIVCPQVSRYALHQNTYTFWRKSKHSLDLALKWLDLTTKPWAVQSFPLSDQSLLQLLSHNVSVDNPLREEYDETLAGLHREATTIQEMFSKHNNLKGTTRFDANNHKLDHTY